MMHTLTRDDVQAERGLLASMLETAQPSEDFDPIWITHDGRRALFCALDLLRAEGLLCPMIDVTNAGVAARVAEANAEIVADAVIQAETWPCADDPRLELIQILDCAGHYFLSAHYSARLKRAWERRETIYQAQRTIAAAERGA